MSALYRASVYADPPVYAAGHAARPYDVPGAAIRGGVRRRTSFLWPAVFFIGGGMAGALVAVTIVRAVLK
ncbi:MAG: hypothetical protein QM698_07280 [Micropepsaceae bacterium]